jgi:DNA-binding response OmpR family regulator
MAQIEKTLVSSSLRVLIVSDDTIASKAICEALKDTGCQTFECKRAAEAMGIIRKEDFDCLIIDCLLQVGTADHVVLSSRRDPKGRNFSTPIILMGRNFEVALLKIVRGFIADTFKKPFDMETLVFQVHNLCNPAKKIKAADVA